MIIKKYYKLVRVSHTDNGTLRITNISNEVGEFTLTRGSGTYRQNLEYSTDGVNWISVDVTNPPSVNVQPNSNIYFRGSNPNGLGNGGNATYLTFNFNKDFKVGGNIMSIINSSATSVPTYAFNSLFKGNTNLISASEITFGNAETINQYGLSETFSNCTYLTSPLDLSCFTTINQYSLSNLYAGCSRLPAAITPNVQDLSGSSLMDNWLGNAAGDLVPAGTTKTVSVPTGATIATNSRAGIPTGWTRVDY